MKHILTLGSCLILFLSCRQDPPPVCYSTPSDVKEWFLFHPGTYWVYVENGSGIRDSVYVTSSDLKIPEGYDSESSPYLVCRKSSVHFNENYNDYVPLRPLREECTPCIGFNDACFSVVREKSTTSLFLGIGSLFIFHPTDGFDMDFVVSGWEVDTIVVESTELVQLNDSTILECKKISHSYDPLENNQSTYYYYAKNYGLIKKVLVDSNKTWLLDHYSIVQ